ncbi:MAG: alkaline phosphatase [Gemmatimonadota bacterium]
MRRHIPVLRLACAALFAAAALACTSTPPQRPAPHPADVPRVIFIIGDGVGLAYWSALEYAHGPLAVADFPVVGFIDPRNISERLPESAATATALATGVQTYYHALGVGPDSLPRRTVLEVAEAAGLATGLVSTTRLTDATPAAFAAHVTDRKQQGEIAIQMAAQHIEVLLGAGRDPWDGTLPGGRDLLPEMRQRYTVVESAEALAAAADTAGALLGLLPFGDASGPEQRDPSLAAMTTAALAVLDRDPEGFFLMVENEHTDHRGHENAPLDVIVAEMWEIDRAVRAAVAYRDRRPGTLIVVAADHETGGLSLLRNASGEWTAAWATTSHTADLVPLFAIGPGAERFAGLQSGAAIGQQLLRLVAPDCPAGARC